jgi:AcrR family transcriptional regulator
MVVMKKTARRAGRPLSFDRDAALHSAMLEFWRHGYEGASVATLTQSMGITAPSLYTAFGDKKRLFIEAMHLYFGDPELIAQTMGAAPSGRDAARTLMRASAKLFTDPATPPGCLLASATASGPASSADVRAVAAQLRSKTRRLLTDRIGRDVQEAKLDPATRPGALADMVLVLVQGMSVLARDGVSRERLYAMIEQALAGWPAGLD